MATNNDLLRKPNMDVLPGVEQLNNHFILGEMITNLGQLDPFHPDIDISILIDWLKDVQDHKVDLESTMRKLLKTFSKTKAFQDRFNPLDESSKAKINAFADGKSAQDVVSKSGFAPKPSESNQHRFRGLDYRRPENGKPNPPGQPAKNDFWTKVQHLCGCIVQDIEEDEKESKLEVPDDLQERRSLFSDRWGGGDKVVYEDNQKMKVMEVQATF